MERRYDLIERTSRFSKDIRKFLLSCPPNGLFYQDAKQAIRSSGSVGANYIEAQDPISEKDAFLRLRICRKEAKETAYRLELREVYGLSSTHEAERIRLLNEAKEKTKIFGAIVQKLNVRK